MLDVGAASKLHHLRGGASSVLAKLVTPLAVASDAPLTTASVEAPAADVQPAGGDDGAAALEETVGKASVRALPFDISSSSSSAHGPAPAPGPAPTPAPAPAPGVFTPLRWFTVEANKDGFTFNSLPTTNPHLEIMVGQFVTFAVDTDYSHPFVLTDSSGVQLMEPEVTDNGQIAGGVMWNPQLPGTFGYTCPYHPSFTGTITVS